MDLGNHTLKSIKKVAAKLLSLSDGITVWCFEGDMGAGKTTLIQEICKVLGVSERVSSPTFSLVNEYKGLGGMPVYHFDLHRLQNIEEAREIGFSDYLYSGHFCLIEWPQVVESILPDSYLYITITTLDSDTRNVTLQRKYH